MTSTYLLIILLTQSHIFAQKNNRLQSGQLGDYFNPIMLITEFFDHP